MIDMSGMESAAVDDDICILKHETAYGPTESPVSVCAGDESVASHFALVTAYEDIKKRLRDTEKENALLRRKVKQLEDKHFRPEAPPAEGPQYMNKAFSAYRGIYIEKEDLQLELNKLRKEKSDMERCLTEQLQARELELLQLRSEVETNQVMKSLNHTADYWRVERDDNCSGLHDDQSVIREQLEVLFLKSRSKTEEITPVGLKSSCICLINPVTLAVVQSYHDVLSEASRLHTVIRSQSDLMKKLRERHMVTGLRRDSAVPVQCLDDVEKITEPARGSPSRPPSAPPLPSGSGTQAVEGAQENCLKDPWPVPRPAPLGSPGVRLARPQRMGSLDDSSWSFPSPPRPNDALFWDKSAPADWSQPY
ncbi:5-azacytidine-induced protein 2 NF-kappa-B-activating kinase-associated protein 1 [Triplophysa tibetana]|uniref:5-azacytidine-induced protein 2 NF-kappa-B-activating kinase-associated protein 1 n=1 Tax=Triplophysa tibetana TaxID=1572043 RepID=A0A5A9N0T0_9TELE|nr:5-azacytidine-induced protein 2 NF-kappa-B-activating kinase-associated protein 1 [Triplophysa tibetana]